MEAALTRFVRVLRNAEVRVSPAETLDAMRALALAGYDDREHIRAVLEATLAKTIDEKAIFHECFDNYFSMSAAEADNDDPQDSENPPPASFPDRAEAPANAAESRIEDGEMSPLSSLLFEGNRAAIQLAIESAGREVGLENMRIFTQKGLYTRRILEQMDWQGLQADVLALEQRPDSEPPGHAEGVRLKQLGNRLRDQVLQHVERSYLMYASGEMRELRESVLRSARLSNIERRDMDRLRKLVRRIARKLATRYARKRRVYRRGLLDVPRTLRKANAHDGIIFNPRWRQQRKDRPVLIAVCDVSGSVSAYSRFLLMFLYSLGDVLPRVRSFVFSSDLAEVTPLFRDDPPEVAVELARQRYGYGSTDYAAAFRGLLEAAGRDLDGGATVVMLGDARNNYGDPALAELKEISRRAKRLVWLNPEAESGWGSGDSEMMRYRSACSEVRVCQTLTHLERFANDLLRNRGSA